MHLQRWHGWCYVQLLPSRLVLCTPYNHAPFHFMQSHVRKVHAYLAVTCHLHFWQNDRDLLHAIAVTRWWSGYRNKRQYRKFTLEMKILPRPFNHESGVLTTELSLTTRIQTLSVSVSVCLSLLYMVLLALCGHLQTQRVCRALHPMSGEDGILVTEVPRGVQHASSARTSPRRVVGLAQPNQSTGRASP